MVRFVKDFCDWYFFFRRFNVSSANTRALYLIQLATWVLLPVVRTVCIANWHANRALQAILTAPFRVKSLDSSVTPNWLISFILRWLFRRSRVVWQGSRARLLNGSCCMLDCLTASIHGAHQGHCQLVRTFLALISHYARIVAWRARATHGRRQSVEQTKWHRNLAPSLLCSFQSLFCLLSVYLPFHLALMTCLLYIGNGHSHSDAPFKFLHIIGPSTSDSFGIDYCCTFARIGPLQYHFHFSKWTISIHYVRYVLSELFACVNCSLLIATSSRSGWFYGFLIVLAACVQCHPSLTPTSDEIFTQSNFWLESLHGVYSFCGSV